MALQQLVHLLITESLTCSHINHLFTRRLVYLVTCSHTNHLFTRRCVYLAIESLTCSHMNQLFTHNNYFMTLTALLSTQHEDISLFVENV